MLGTFSNAFQVDSVNPVTGATQQVTLALPAGRERYGLQAFIRGNQVYLLGGLRLSSGVEVPFDGADVATFDATGKLGPFKPHAADMVNGRGYYNLIVGGNSDMWVINGSADSNANSVVGPERAELR